MQPADQTLPAPAGTQLPDSAQQRRLAAQMLALAEITPAVAHDLRAPINAMVLNLEVLRETVSSGRAREPGGEERLLRYAGVLRDELARLHSSLEIFLGHISPRSDRMDTVDLRDLAGELAALLVSPARKQQIEVKATLPETRVAVAVNSYLLRQALLHFGLAALAAMPHPGRLEVALASDGDRARLRIAGEGHLPAAKPPPCFAPERLEVAHSLLATQQGEARICGAAAGGQVGFEIDLPLSHPEVR